MAGKRLIGVITPEGKIKLLSPSEAGVVEEEQSHAIAMAGLLGEMKRLADGPKRDGAKD